MNDQLREWVHLFAVATGQDEAAVVVEMELTLRNSSFLRLDWFGLSSAVARGHFNQFRTPGVHPDAEDAPAFERAVTATALDKEWFYRAVVEDKASAGEGAT
jgi:hypothetical protein